MEKLRIKTLTLIHLSITEMGESVLSKIAYYSTGLGVLFEIVLSFAILSFYQKTQFGIFVQLSEKFFINTLVYTICIAISLVLKIELIIGIILFSKITNVLFKQIILYSMVILDSSLSIIDATLLALMIQQSFFLVLFSGINVFVFLVTRFINQIITFNYSFIYPYPLKKMPSILFTILIAILQILFVVFQIIMKNDVAMILFFVVAAIRLIVQTKFMLQTPYLSGIITILKIISFNNWICLVITQVGNIVFEIVSSNTFVLFCIISIFGILFNYTIISYIKEKRLVADIQTTENWQDINIKVQYSYELIFNDNLQRLSTISKEHFQKCKISDCRCKWKQINSPIDFRRQVFANKSELFQLKVFLKYYLLVLCENYKSRFNDIPQVWVVYISALSVLNLYPKLLYHASHFQFSFSHEINFSEKMIVKYLKCQVLQFIQEKNIKDNVLQIQKIKKLQQLNRNLDEKIKKISQIKYNIWKSFLESPVQQSNIETLFKSEIEQRNCIQQTYQSILEIPHNKSALWRIMTTYCRNIIEDHNFERIVRKNISKQDLTTKNADTNNDLKQGSFPRKIEDFLQLQNNYCLLKISTGQKNMGCIQWHNDSCYQMFGFPKTKRLIGESVDLFIPEIFRQRHASILKQWYEYPRSHKFNRPTQAYMRTNLRQFQPVNIYIKIITQQNDYGVFVILYQNSHQRFLVLNENLEDIINSNFIKQKLQTKIPHNNLLLPLLSKDYNKLRQKTQQKFQNRVLKFPLISNYDEYYQQYNLQMKQLDPDLTPQKFKQQKQYIMQRISISISKRQTVEQIEFEVKVKYITMNKQNETKKYILVQQSIDEQSYFEENLKLKKQRSRGSNSIFSESSKILDTNNKNDKDVLDFQQSQSSITSTKNNTNRDFIEKLINGDLKRLKKILYVCLFIYFYVQIIRLVEFFYFQYTYKQLIQADINIGTFILNAETLYDNSLFNGYTSVNTGTDVPFTNALIFAKMVNYNYNIVLTGLQQQSLNIDNQWIKYFSSSQMIWFSTVDHVYNFPSPVWFQSWGKVSQIVSSRSILSYTYMLFLRSNYPYIRQASHKFSSYFLEQSVTSTKTLKIVNIFVLPLNVIIIIVFLFFFYKYLQQKQKTRHSFIKIFAQIDQPSIKSYAQKYHKVETIAIDYIQQQIIQPEIQTNYLNRKVTINQSKLSGVYKIYMFLISLILVFDIVITISTTIKADNMTAAYENQNKLRQSFFYQMQSLIEIKQLAMGLKPYSDQFSLQQLNKENFNQFKDNAIKIFNQFSDKDMNGVRKNIMNLLIENLCSVLDQQLSDDLRKMCDTQFKQEIFRSGIMTFSHFIVDVLIEQSAAFIQTFGQNKIGVFPQIMTNASLVDATISSTFRIMIVQRIQKQIQIIVDHFILSLKSDTVIIAACTLVVLLVYVFLAYLFKKKQTKQWQYIYGSLLIIPEKQLLKASTVSKMVFQLKDKSK